MRKRILVVSMNSPALDRKSWSGTPYSIYMELKEFYDFDDVYIKPHNTMIGLMRCALSKFIFHKYIPLRLTIAYSIKVAKSIKRQLKKQNYDLILCANNPGAIAFLKVNIPIVYISDCVTSSIIDYYWFNVGSVSKNEMNYITRKALEKADSIMLTSKWAMKAALRDYKVPENKLHVFHLGANVEVDKFEHKEHDGINLLFIGVEWERKGADVAIDCIRYLKKIDSNRQYFLHIVGCYPPQTIVDENIYFYGFLNRNVQQEREKLEELRALADFFILPTRAECAGMVFCEACAYSIPSLTYDTGGVGDYVIDGKNGILFSLESSGKEYAETVLRIVNDGKLLQTMQKESYELFLKEYNWKVAGEKVKKEIDNLLQ